jgi:hypothetical protein
VQRSRAPREGIFASSISYSAWQLSQVTNTETDPLDLAPRAARALPLCFAGFPDSGPSRSFRSRARPA